MRKKKNRALLPILLFSLILVLSIGALILADNLRKAQIANPGTYTNQDDIPRLTAQEAFQAVQAGDAVLVDTRSEAQFLTQHAAGAINLPVDQVAARLGELDPDTWYVTYCT